MIPSILIPIVLALIVISMVVLTVVRPQPSSYSDWGKFHSIRQAGLQFKVPLIDSVAGKVNLKIQQLDVMVETKTLDNVFVRLKVAVQFRIPPENVYDAFYKLQNPGEQITAYIFDTVRAEVPKMKLDDVFVRKDDIAIAIRRELEEAMNEYGYNIVKALVTDIDPDEEVKRSMNHINAAERKKLAAEYEGEAESMPHRRQSARRSRKQAPPGTRYRRPAARNRQRPRRVGRYPE